jgi:hypothetical protein
MLRRLTWHVFTIGSAVSLVLCVMVILVWIRTWFGPIHLVDYRYVIEFDHRWELGLCRIGHWCVGFPLWALVLGTVALPAIRWRAFVGLTKFARRPRPHGFCESCNYDLRASPDRCPECGRAVSRAV